MTFTWALVAVQFFRRSILGIPWGLLLAGIGLNTVGDISYHYYALYIFDRSNPGVGIWVLGSMITCYALYLHKKHL